MGTQTWNSYRPPGYRFQLRHASAVSLPLPAFQAIVFFVSVCLCLQLWLGFFFLLLRRSVIWAHDWHIMSSSPSSMGTPYTFNARDRDRLSWAPDYWLVGATRLAQFQNSKRSVCDRVLPWDRPAR